MPHCAYCGTPVDAVSFAPCPSCGNPRNGAPRPAQGGTNTGVVIAVIAVIAIAAIGFIGIMAAIAIPNLLTAMQRSKQKRSMADMRSLATAAEAYATDKNKYPDPDALQSELSPTYIRVIPRVDGWAHPIRYECWNKAGSGPCDAYAVGSGGKDGMFEKQALREYAEGGGATTNFNNDIVFSNGAFVQYPEGVQH